MVQMQDPQRLTAREMESERPAGEPRTRAIPFWSSVLLIALSWVLGPFFPVAPASLIWTALVAALVGTVGGLGTALTLKRADRSLPRPAIWQIAGGWTLAVVGGAVVTALAARPIYEALVQRAYQEGLSGSSVDSFSSGSLVLLLFFLMGILIGVPGGLLTGRSLGQHWHLTSRNKVMLVLGWTVGWLSPAILGSIGLAAGVGSSIGGFGSPLIGAIGGGVMFWQLKEINLARYRA